MAKYKVAKLSRYRDRGGDLVKPKGPPMSEATKARLQARAEVQRWGTLWCRLWARIGVEVLRPSARERLLVAAVLDHTSDTARRMLDVALLDYKLRFPNARGDRHIVGRTAYSTDGREIHGASDYCCRYCGKVLYRGHKGMWSRSHAPDHEAHAMRCAIMSLAGSIVTAPPGYNPVDPERVRVALEALVAATRALVLAWASDVVDDTMRRFANLELDL